MRVMLLGAGGMLAHDLIATAPSGVELCSYTRAQLDITNPKQLGDGMRRSEPNLVINVAAYTKVDQAEQERETAFAVNGAAPGEVGRAAGRIGARVVHYSTDYIFDGRAKAPYCETDQPNPLNVYGASKLEGERNLIASGAQYLIIRTQWLFGTHGRSFPRTMWERAVERRPSRVVADQIGRPTGTVDLARATWELIESGLDGVIHVANAGVASWYDVARRVYRACRAEHLVESCTTTQSPTVARRPLWSALSTRRMEQVLGGGVVPWADAIDRFVARMQSDSVPDDFTTTGP